MSRILQASFYAHYRHRLDSIAEDSSGDTSKIIASARDLAKVWIDQRWMNTSSSVSLLPNEALPAILKEFWYSVVLAARYSSDPQHMPDLVNLIRERHEMGVLKRDVPNHGGRAQGHTFSSAGDSEEVACTQDGMVWSDLPYLRSVLFDAFLQSPPIMPTSQWLHLNTFAAQVTAEGLKDLSYYAIWAMFDAFETVELYPQASAVVGKNSTHIPRTDRLDLVTVWFRYCGSSIYRACLADSQPPDQSHDDYSCRWNRDGPEFVGHLAQEAGVMKSGFSTERWLFWKARLVAIRDASGNEESETMRTTYKCSFHLLQAMKESEFAATA